MTNLHMPLMLLQQKVRKFRWLYCLRILVFSFEMLSALNYAEVGKTELWNRILNITLWFRSHTAYKFRNPFFPIVWELG